MAQNLRRSAPPASPDLAAGEGCGHELSRSSSSSASSLTLENSVETFHRNANARPGKCTAWTDEKHNLYLNCLEASFVRQLHHSMGFRTWCPEQKINDPNSLTDLPASNHSSPKQILQDGRWQNNNPERNQLPLDDSADSHKILDNPCLCHFRCAGKVCTTTSADLEESSMLPCAEMHLRGKNTASRGSATTSKQIPASHRCPFDAGGVITEVSDQNFANEDQEKSSSLPVAKRLKTVVSDNYSQDQVVPLAKFHITEISTHCATTSSDRDEPFCQEWSSESLERLVSPQGNIESFLR